MNILTTGHTQLARDTQETLNQTTIHTTSWCYPEHANYYAKSLDCDVVIFYAEKPYADMLPDITRIKNVPVLVVTRGTTPLSSSFQEALFGKSWAVVMHQVSLDAVIAQAQSLLQFKQHRAVGELSLGNLTCDMNAQSMRIGGTEIDLPRREFVVLESLMRRPERFVAKSALQEIVFGDDLFEFEFSGENVLESHVSKLKKKIRRETSQVGIGSRRYQGYIMTTNPIYIN